MEVWISQDFSHHQKLFVFNLATSVVIKNFQYAVRMAAISDELHEELCQGPLTYTCVPTLGLLQQVIRHVYAVPTSLVEINDIVGQQRLVFVVDVRKQNIHQQENTQNQEDDVEQAINWRIVSRFQHDSWHVVGGNEDVKMLHCQFQGRICCVSRCESEKDHTHPAEKQGQKEYHCQCILTCWQTHHDAREGVPKTSCKTDEDWHSQQSVKL
mmetsp:Transcript_21870/g.40729  ORF Transcript_21870/g.40729 Transcript_21870/m.40729 type:complete len:212 (-) Transcript_21870:735-1370(-)